MTNAESQQPELVAADPSTPSSILAKLAEEGDTTIRRIVTSNPNTPLTTLYTLGLDFPTEFLNNPLFTLLQLTDPQLLADNESLVFTLLRCEHLSEHWLLWFQQHHTFQHIPDLPLHITLSRETAHPWCEERYLVALHTQTYIQTLQQLALDGNRYVRAAARLTLENQ